MEFLPLYFQDKLDIVNPRGIAGILTLWSKPERIRESLQLAYPKLFESDSNLVTLTSLYGNGLPQLLSNLANNPQVYRLAVTGNDTTAIPSYTFLNNFLTLGVTREDIGGVDVARVKETTCLVDPQLEPQMYRHLQVERFKPSDLEGIANFVANSSPLKTTEEDRIAIKLFEPEFTDYPSDPTSHNIISLTPLEAWMDVLFHIDRFGRNVELKKGIRRALYNLDVTIENPEFEPDEKLLSFNFDPNELREYQRDILDGSLPEGMTYRYGHRLRAYWGLDSLDEIVKRLKRDPLDRHSLVSLWDTSKDLALRRGVSSPCFSDAYFVLTPDEKLMMTASFRTHNAISAWLTNIYGLRAIQEHVANESGLEPGQINVRSRWISLDPSNSRTISALSKVKEKRRIKLDVDDPKGYYTIETEGEEIVVTHYTSESMKLDEYRGKDPEKIKSQLRQISGFSTSDHAMWFGLELGRVEAKLNQK